MDSAAPTASRVGPNAITQMGAALVTRQGWATAAEVYSAAGIDELLAVPPTSRVPEDWVVRLHWAVHNALAPATAEALAWEAGRRTADYLLAWRIPGAVQWSLRALRPRPSARLFVRAIRRNAWTFAGSGRFEAALGRTCVLTIAANPIAVPGCPWHRGVFARLFETLVVPNAAVVETECCARGNARCRFEIGLS